MDNEWLENFKFSGSPAFCREESDLLRTRRDVIAALATPMMLAGAAVASPLAATPARTYEEQPARAAQGMTNEFETIVESHYTGLYRFGLSLAKDESTACDLTQQTFLKWARHGHQLRDRSKVKTWLFTTLHREFLALRRKTRDVADEEELENLPAETSVSGTPSIDAQAAVEALQQLDETFRAPVAMFYLEEMSYAEIAECLEVPVGTIMSRLSRGRERLRKILLSEPSR